MFEIGEIKFKFQTQNGSFFIYTVAYVNNISSKRSYSSVFVEIWKVASKTKSSHLMALNESNCT